MASKAGLQVYIGATTQDLAAGLEEAKRQIDGWAKDAVAKLNQAGAATKPAVQGFTSLGEAAKKFASEQRGEARTVNFFVQEIANIVPVTADAKVALSGFGQALVGGVGVFSALQLVTTAIGLFVQESQREAEASRKAAEAAAARAQAYTRTRLELERLRFTQGGGSGEVFDAHQANQEVEVQVAAARKTLDEIRASFDRAKAAIPGARALADEEAAKYYANLRALLDKVKAAAADLAVAEANRAAVAEIGSRKAAAAIDRETEALARRNTEASKGVVDARDASDTKATFGTGKGISVLPLGGDALPKVGGDPAENARRAQEAQDAYNNKLKETTALYAKWGNVAADVVAGVLTGQKSIGEAISGVAQLVFQTMVQMLVQKAAASLAAHALERPVAVAEVTSAAGRAGAEGAAAVAGIPVVGPAMAAEVLGSLPAAIMASMIPLASAAGGWRVPTGVDPITQLHAGEHVIPRRIAERYEAGAPGGGDGITVHVAGVIDARNLERALTANDGAVARAMRKMRRRRRG